MPRTTTLGDPGHDTPPAPNGLAGAPDPLAAVIERAAAAADDADVRAWLEAMTGAETAEVSGGAADAPDAEPRGRKAAGRV